MSPYCVACLVALCAGVSSAPAEFVPSHDSLIGKAVAAPRVHPESLQGFDISRLTPEQRQILAFRMELLRRRRAALAGPASNAAAASSNFAERSQKESAPGSEDLEGADTLGFGAAAFPLLGLYGLGLGGLGVGFGPLAYAGLFG